MLNTGELSKLLTSEILDKQKNRKQFIRSGGRR